MTETTTETSAGQRLCPGYLGRQCGAPLDPALPAGELCDPCDSDKIRDQNIADEHQGVAEDIEQALRLIESAQQSITELTGNRLYDEELTGVDAADMQQGLADAARLLRNVDRAHRLHLTVCQPTSGKGQR